MSDHDDEARSLPGDRAAILPLIAEPVRQITRLYFRPHDAPLTDRAATASVLEEAVAQLAG